MKKLFFIALIMVVQLAYGQSLSQNLATVTLIRAQSVTESDFRERLTALRAQGIEPTNAQRLEILNMMIDSIIALQAAERERIVASNNDILEALQAMTGMPRATLADIERAYRSNVAEVARTNPEVAMPSWEQFLTSVREEVTRQMLFQRMVQPRTPTDAEVVQAYNDNPDNFNMPEQVRVSHIFFNFAGMNAEQRREVQARASRARQDIASGAVTFEQAVSIYSDDRESASRLGDIGFIPNLPAMVEVFGPTLIGAMFSQQTGVVSAVVEGQLGYHIFRITDRQAARKLGLSDINPFEPRQTIHQMVTMQLMQRNWLEDMERATLNLRSQSNIVINESLWGPWARGERN